MTETIDFATYSRNMRKNLTDYQQIHQNGDINHQYFLVKKGTYWSKEEDDILLKFIEKNPIGEWQNRDILKDFTNIELDLRTCILLKISDISQYIGKTMTLEQVKEESEKNHQLGIQKNKFKNNVYEI